MTTTDSPLRAAFAEAERRLRVLQVRRCRLLATRVTSRLTGEKSRWRHEDPFPLSPRSPAFAAVLPESHVFGLFRSHEIANGSSATFRARLTAVVSSR